MSFADDNKTPDIVKKLVVGYIDGPPGQAASEIDEMVQGHAAGLGALMGSTVFCRAIYNTPPLILLDETLFG
jgi:hypothetical protein